MVSRLREKKQNGIIIGCMLKKGCRERFLCLTDVFYEQQFDKHKYPSTGPGLTRRET